MAVCGGRDAREDGGSEEEADSRGLDWEMLGVFVLFCFLSLFCFCSFGLFCFLLLFCFVSLYVVSLFYHYCRISACICVFFCLVFQPPLAKKKKKKKNRGVILSFKAIYRIVGLL